MFLSDYFLLIKRFLLSLAFFTLSRLGFYLYNLSYFSNAQAGETIRAFLYGLRFDLATALIANLFFILASLIPFRSAWYEKVLKGIFLLSNFIYLGLIFGDYEFFAFNGKKLTYDLFLMGSDIKDQSLQLFLNYWYLALLNFICVGLLWKFYPKYHPIAQKLKWYKAIGLSVFFFVLTGIGVRGGLQLRSISPKEAFVFEKHELGNLALNSAYSLIRSFGNEGLPNQKYFKNDKAAVRKIITSRDFSQSDWGAADQNVVVIIIESFSQEYIDKGLAPFFTELTKKGLYFSNNFANGRRSMEALPSIMTGFPSLAGAPLYQTQYQSNKYYPLPELLKSNGYKTSFYHGGKRGTMDFDAYCYSIGFEEYHALEDYPDQNDFDGHWGVYDHKYLEHVVNDLDRHKRPFFSGVFTLSSHQPYSIPSSLKHRFPDGSLPIHASIGYADYSLELFFKKAKEKKWYQNTLFIITADHTQKLESAKYQSSLGRYRVPLLFFHPKIDLSSKTERKVTQHADVLSSVMDFLNLDMDKRLLYGSSVFGPGQGRVINKVSDTYYLLKGQDLVTFDGVSQKSFKVDDDYLEMTRSEENKALLQELKAYIQYTNNGLRNNSIYGLE